MCDRIYNSVVDSRNLSTEILDSANFDVVCWLIKEMRKNLPDAQEITITVREVREVNEQAA